MNKWSFTLALAGGALALFLWSASAAAKKPPRTLGAPAITDRYWSVTVRTERGKTTIVSARHLAPPMGTRVVLHAHIGPMSLVMVGAAGRVLARHAFAWPLLGTSPDSDELGFEKGLTAEVELRVPHVPGLRTLRVEDALKKLVAKRDEARWPGEPEDAAPPPGTTPDDEAAAAQKKREPRELFPPK